MDIPGGTNPSKGMKKRVGTKSSSIGKLFNEFLAFKKKEKEINFGERTLKGSDYRILRINIKLKRTDVIIVVFQLVLEN